MAIQPWPLQLFVCSSFGPTLLFSSLPLPGNSWRVWSRCPPVLLSADQRIPRPSSRLSTQRSLNNVMLNYTIVFYCPNSNVIVPPYIRILLSEFATVRMRVLYKRNSNFHISMILSVPILGLYRLLLGLWPFLKKLMVLYASRGWSSFVSRLPWHVSSNFRKLVSAFRFYMTSLYSWSNHVSMVFLGL